MRVRGWWSVVCLSLAVALFTTQFENGAAIQHETAVHFSDWPDDDQVANVEASSDKGVGESTQELAASHGGVTPPLTTANQTLSEADPQNRMVRGRGRLQGPDEAARLHLSPIGADNSTEPSFETRLLVLNPTAFIDAAACDSHGWNSVGCSLPTQPWFDLLHQAAAWNGGGNGSRSQSDLSRSFDHCPSGQYVLLLPEVDAENAKVGSRMMTQWAEIVLQGLNVAPGCIVTMDEEMPSTVNIRDATAVFAGLSVDPTGDEVLQKSVASYLQRNQTTSVRGDEEVDKIFIKRVSSTPSTSPAILPSFPLKETDSVIVILGNEPLDSRTPTLDTVKRSEIAMEEAAKRKRSILLFSGGVTVSKHGPGVSEARMGALISVALGVPCSRIVLEEESLHTWQNAKFSSALLGGSVLPALGRVVYVTKPSHFDRALGYFHQYDNFRQLEEVTSGASISKEDMVLQMSSYLDSHPSDSRVRERLSRLEAELSGTDWLVLAQDTAIGA